MGKLSVIAGAAIGAGMMYLFDPKRGNRRRALLRDRLVGVAHDTEGALDTALRDLNHRASGLAAEILSYFAPESVDDVVLAERVRSKLGRIVGHPGAIDVIVQDGRVTLSGPILAEEVEHLLTRVRSVRGVRSVVNELEVHERAGNIPDLQGEVSRTGEEFEFFQSNWSPAARLVGGVAGSALAFYGARRRDIIGIGLGTIGMGLFARGLTNLGLRRLVGLGGRRAIDVQKTINVAAAVERVYAIWSCPETFPRFMSHIREVRQVGADRYHWTVSGPAGMPVNFDAVITKRVPNEVVAWKTRAGSSVDHAGIVRFDANQDGTTRVSVRMSYNPPVGALGHVVASLFAVDPKRAMDDDLARFKSLVEEGKATAHGETVTSAEVIPSVAAHRNEETQTDG